MLQDVDHGQRRNGECGCPDGSHVVTGSVEERVGDRAGQHDADNAEAHADEQRRQNPGSQRSTPIVSEFRVPESERLSLVEPTGRPGIEAEPGEELQQQRGGGQEAEYSEFTVGEAVRQQREQYDSRESRDSKRSAVHACLAK